MLSADFSTETLQATRERHDILKAMKGKNLQPRILYLARLSFRFYGELKNFTDKQKLNPSFACYQHHQTSFIRNVKGTSLIETEKATTRNMQITKGKISLVKSDIQ